MRSGFRRSWIFALVLNLALLAMVGFGSRRGIIEPGHRWPADSSIRVCIVTHVPPWGFFDPDRNPRDVEARELIQFFRPWTAEKTAALREVIEKEFRKSEVGIEFVGWEDCPSLLKPESTDVVVVPLEGMERNASGRRLDQGWADVGPQKHRPAVVFLGPGEHEDPDLAKTMFQLIALHEFGHIAGLRHEHVLRNAPLLDQGPADPVCIATVREDQLAEPLAQGDFEGKIVTSYDRNSVMNYGLAFLYDEARGKLSDRVTEGGVLSGVAGKRWGSVGTLLSLGYFLDPRNSEVRVARLDSHGDDAEILYRLFPRFSSGDVRALRCLYGLETEERCWAVPIARVRPTTQLPQDRKISVRFTEEQRRQLVDRRRSLPGTTLLFAEGRLSFVSAQGGSAWRDRSHCRVSVEKILDPGLSKRKWSNQLRASIPFASEPEKSNEAILMGGAWAPDLESRYGSWICSSDVGSGELYLTESSLRRIFGSALVLE